MGNKISWNLAVLLISIITQLNTEHDITPTLLWHVQLILQQNHPNLLYRIYIQLNWSQVIQNFVKHFSCNMHLLQSHTTEAAHMTSDIISDMNHVSKNWHLKACLCDQIYIWLNFISDNKTEWLLPSHRSVEDTSILWSLSSKPAIDMITLWHENTFSIVDPLWGECTGHQWIPLEQGQ